MNLTILPKNLIEAATRAAAIADRKPAQPILGSVLIEADGDYITVTSSQKSMAFVGRYQAQIERLAMERMTSEGFDVYGDEAFRKDEAQLWDETMQEVADAVFYRAVRLARDRGELG